MLPTFGVFLEGYGDPESVIRAKPSYGARSTVVFTHDTSTNVSLQPLMNHPLTGREASHKWNATFAAGPAFHPLSLHATACARNLNVVTYGACAQWLSQGLVGIDVNASLFLVAMFANVGDIR